MNIRIFISHSSRDKDIARALRRLLQEALPLEETAILCTSLPGYGLPSGEQVLPALALAVKQAEVFLCVLTRASLRNQNVMLELGARWISEKPLHLLLIAGTPRRRVPAALKLIQLTRSADQSSVHGMIDRIASELGIQPRQTEKWHGAVQKLPKRRTGAAIVASAVGVMTSLALLAYGFGVADQVVWPPSLAQELVPVAAPQRESSPSAAASPRPSSLPASRDRPSGSLERPTETEPNDIQSLATPIDLGENGPNAPTEGRVGFGKDTNDWFSIRAPSDGALSLRVTNTNPVSGFIEVFSVFEGVRKQLCTLGRRQDCEPRTASIREGDILLIEIRPQSRNSDVTYTIEIVQFSPL